MSGNPENLLRRRKLAVRLALMRRELGEQIQERKKGGGVSRGPGRCQRAILEQVKEAPGGELTRRKLEAPLILRGFSRSNVLRSTRALVRARLLLLDEGRNLDRSVVRLPPPPEPVTDDKLAGLLEELKMSNA